MTNERRPSQADRLLALLRRVGERGITPLDALDLVGSNRLAARIHDLKVAGHRIRSERATMASGAVVARYVLDEAPEEASAPPEPPRDPMIAEGQEPLPW